MSRIVITDQSSVRVVVAQQGPPGPSFVPDPAGVADGRMLAVQDGEYIDIAPPSGTGDMQTLVYDPAGRAANVFNIANMSGVIDCGTF